MPSFRLPADNRRRRSSAMLIGLNPAKPGTYGIGLPPPSQKPVMFAPNVTPVTYVEPEDNSDSAYSPDASAALFPPSEAPSAGPVRRRAPPGKRRSQGYIPRPPNAFMLFRADFVRQKHVPGSIETNHGSLSKIIGNCWRALPLEEKRVWEVKAKHAKAEHKAKYPNYRFRPVHNKNKEKKKEKPLPMPEDERRCEEVAQLLLEGKKGDELAEAVRNLDRLRSLTPVIQPAPLYTHRRSSSVPLPNDYYNPYANISIPSAPFFMPSRPASPMSRQQRMLIGQRRPSSAGPAFFRSWTMPNPQLAPAHMFQHDTEPLPEPDPTLFNTFSNFNFQSSHPEQPAPPFNVNELMTSLPPHGQAHDTHLGLGPLDSLGPQDILHMYNHTSPPANNNPADASELEMTNWLSSSLQHSPSLPSSHTSSTYSGSPQPSDKALPLPVFAPQPVHPDQTPTNAMFGSVENMGPSDVWSGQELGYGNATNMAYSPESTGCAPSTDFAFSNGFEFGDFVKNEA
ncbi:Repressor ROX1 [Leucoagaricus sp. SymC.cos]|nr:Repressor ROX1 [Leucoagaricus sp. SymC.cos]